MHPLPPPPDLRWVVASSSDFERGYDDIFFLFCYDLILLFFSVLYIFVDSYFGLRGTPPYAGTLLLLFIPYTSYPFTSGSGSIGQGGGGGGGGTKGKPQNRGEVGGRLNKKPPGD